MNRDTALDAVGARRRAFDLVVIGGGATGSGIALDAASRKLDVLLLEAHDFGAGTSSRSTKIIHGGVRYLAQGRIGLVREALRERGLLLQNAPHLVQPLPFVVPIDSLWDRCRYFGGLHLYDLLAGSERLEGSTWLSRNDLARAFDTVDTAALNGAMRYYDGQFDDSRLLINLLDTAVSEGAICLNYAEVIAFGKSASGRLRAVTFRDRETGQTHEVEAKAFINATGVASDAIVKLDDDTLDDTIMPSQGAHIVVERKFLPGNEALLMPRTPDGRIMFAIPWLGHVLIGTTDTPIEPGAGEPVPLPHEIDMILGVAARYLKHAPQRTDILSMFAGIRPLVRAHDSATTAQASREHRIETLPSGLISISGGKWTTYRLMAEQCVDLAVRETALDAPASMTRTLRLRNCPASGAPDSYQPYGSDTAAVADLSREAGTANPCVHPALPHTAGECVWAIRHEMARTVEDVLARRTRALFLNARAAIEVAPAVGAMLRDELNLTDARMHEQLENFERLARHYF